ncbi:uncharacterized protein LOC133744954 [Rosa rugosa]|uniref:uncharacterized protein LOC133744954 n=1 Tax=Rosa rugosa TaxID=74645 RepID=UPI002B40CB86|nr:uncharacterized protein LOC133744954 [Rosa rugosa]
MDHRWRNLRQGLIKLHEDDHHVPSSQQTIGDEKTKIFVDEYAAAAINRVVTCLCVSSLGHNLDAWPRFFYSLDTHVNAVLKYDRPKLNPPTDEAWLKVTHHCRLSPLIVGLCLREWVKSEHFLTGRDIDNVQWVRSSAAGYGYRGLKGQGESFSLARNKALTIVETLSCDQDYARRALEDSTPDMAFSRAQLSQMKVKRKVKPVWGEAFHYALLEGLFADPLIRHFLQTNDVQDSFYCIGHMPLLSPPGSVSSKLHDHDYVYMLDWTDFEASVQEWEIRFAFELLETLLIFPSHVDFHIWRFIVELFIYRKIVTPNGDVYLKTQGIPFGSCFTTIIGSITNYVRVQYLFMRSSGSLATVFTYGDDSLIGVKDEQYTSFPMDNFNPICDEFSWRIGVFKSSYEDHINSFLLMNVERRQRDRDVLACLRMLMFPEYEVESGEISVKRARSIWVDSRISPGMYSGIRPDYLFEIYKSLKIRYGSSNAGHVHIEDGGGGRASMVRTEKHLV